jgi:hypothetical protein
LAVLIDLALDAGDTGGDVGRLAGPLMMVVFCLSMITFLARPSTTLRPLGPSVTLTASAKRSTLRSMRSRASVEFDFPG